MIIRPLLLTSASTDGGCEYWTYWSQVVGLGPDVFVIKWLLYILWAVSLQQEQREAATHLFSVYIDTVCYDVRLPSQVFGTVCRWIRHFGN